MIDMKLAVFLRHWWLKTGTQLESLANKRGYVFEDRHVSIEVM